MRYMQSNIPSPNKVYDFSIVDFTGGLNNRSEVIESNQCSDVVNMAFNYDTVMDKRNGTQHFDTLELTGEVTFIDEYKPYDEEPQLIRATDTEIYFGNALVTTVAGQVSGANYSGKYYFTDGSVIRAYGKFPIVKSTYEEVKGTPIDDYAVLEMTNPPETFTPLATSHTEGKTVYDYDTLKFWYEPCQLEMEDPYKNGNVLPTNPKYIVSHDGRLYVSGSKDDDDNVFISDIQRPAYFPASLPMQVPPDSDKIVSLTVYDDSVIIGRKSDIHVIRGKTNNVTLGLELFEMNKLNTHTGIASNKAVGIVHNYLFFLGSDGQVYSISNATNVSRVLTSTVISKTIDLFKSPISLTREDLSGACSIFHDDQWYLNIKGITLIYSYRFQAWTLYRNINARSFYSYDNVLIWGNDKGRISMYADDYLDYGEPFEAYWRSGKYNMDTALNFKHFKEFFIVAHTFENFLSSVRVKFEIDYSDVTEDFETESKISIFGTSLFGDRFMNRSVNTSIPFLIGRRGRELRFTFTNSYNVKKEFSNLEEIKTYTPDKRKRELVKDLETGKYYLYLKREWVEQPMDKLNQPMRVYQLNGEYEMRRKR